MRKPGASLGNRNRLKHGLYAGLSSAKAIIKTANMQPPEFAITYLESAIDETYARMMKAEGLEYVRLANSLSLLTAALFNGHRTVAFLNGGTTPVAEAIEELRVLKFNED